MSFLPLELLKSGAQKLEIELTDQQLQQFDDFASFMVETNQKFNLTRITEPEDIVVSHLLDSLTCLAAFPIKDEASVIDVGAGPGFPGIPIKIVRPDIKVTLMDATYKKVEFLTEAVMRLGLEDVDPLYARAEEAGRDPRYRERYDVAFARALSEMKIVAELCLPLVRVGGKVIAQKSTDIDGELAQAKPIIGQLGGTINGIKDIGIPCSDITRRLVVISKVKPTPKEFPREYAKIARKKG